MTEHVCRDCGHHVNQHTIPGISIGCVTGCGCELTREEVLDAMLAAARAEGARNMRTKIEALADRADACTDCGRVHPFRQLHHPGQTHSRSNAHSGPCNTWADPDDGHAYSRPAPITSADLRALLADGGEPQ